MAFEIAKAGWLYRQSSILRRWKRNWFVLYQDGNLKYFEDPDRPVAEDATYMPIKCLSINTAKQVRDVQAPPQFHQSCLMQINLRDEETWTLCAETPDDMLAWQFALDEARSQSRQQLPPPYTQDTTPPPSYRPPTGCYRGFPGHVIARPGHHIVAQPGQTIYAQPGQTIHVNEPYSHTQNGPQAVHYVDGQPGSTYYVDGNGHNTRYIYDSRGQRRYRDDGMDVGTGMLAGAAMGSMMMWPLLWW